MSLVLFSLVLLSSLVAWSSAAVLDNSRISSLTKRGDSPQSTACGDVVNSGKRYLEAKLVYDCLTSVPFDPAVGKRFIQYYNDSIQFQSTLELLKAPPPGYQQPAVDVVGRLNQLVVDIDKNVFKNQYDFEAALQTIVYSMHDDHVSLTAGILGAFSFGVDWDFEIVSVSLDGIQRPKMYFTDDLENSAWDGDWNPSAISKINGQDAIAYLTGFAAKQSIGSLEPHSDFNQLMASPAQDIQGYVSRWTGGATFYPGENLVFVLENGTSIGPTPWYAEYHSPGETGPLQTGGDFYNFFVLGLYPESYNPYKDFTPATDDDPPTASSQTRDTTTSDDDDEEDDDEDDDDSADASWDNFAYPDTADIAQKDLGLFGGGSVSGYFLDDIAVLSIPSFVETGLAVGTLSQTIGDFINKSSKAGTKKVVIDLQQNWGGDAFLAFDAFRQFFPNIEPYGGSRMRATSPVNVMGQTITSFWDGTNETEEEHFDLYTSEWVATTRLNANTGREFSSWNEFFGPSQHSGDYFSTIQRYNFSDILFDTISVESNEDFVVHGYGPPGTSALKNSTPPYAAKDIIILSDSLCSSTCAMFMEMMHHEAGVRTVVAGGSPSFGPMQAPSLARGSRSYGITDLLDSNIGYVQSLLRDVKDPNQNFLPNRTNANGIFINYAGLNLRDQIRKGSDVPLQFSYEPADCRIFYTVDTWNDYEALWNYAASAIWTNSSLCVQNSLNYTSSPATVSVTQASSVPSPTALTAQPSSFADTIMKLGFGAPPAPDSGAITACNGQCSIRTTTGTRCDKNNECLAGWFCLTTYQVCSTNLAKPGLVTQPTCFLECDLNAQDICLDSAQCQAYDPSKKKELAELQVDGETQAEIKSIASYESKIATITSQLYSTKPKPTGKPKADLQQNLRFYNKALKKVLGSTPGYCHPPPKTCKKTTSSGGLTAHN